MPATWPSRILDSIGCMLPTSARSGLDRNFDPVWQECFLWALIMSNWELAFRRFRKAPGIHSCILFTRKLTDSRKWALHRAPLWGNRYLKASPAVDCGHVLQCLNFIQPKKKENEIGRHAAGLMVEVAKLLCIVAGTYLRLEPYSPS